MSGSLSASILTNSVDIYRGLTTSLRLTVTLGDEVYDLTGVTLYLTIKCSISDVMNILQLTSPLGGIALAADPRDGYADITFSTVLTQALDPGSYIFDIVLETSLGERFLITGPLTLNVLQGVTRF